MRSPFTTTSTSTRGASPRSSDRRSLRPQAHHHLAPTCSAGRRLRRRSPGCWHKQCAVPHHARWVASSSVITARALALATVALVACTASTPQRRPSPTEQAQGSPIPTATPSLRSNLHGRLARSAPAWPRAAISEAMASRRSPCSRPAPATRAFRSHFASRAPTARRSPIGVADERPEHLPAEPREVHGRRRHVRWEGRPHRSVRRK